MSTAAESMVTSIETFQLRQPYAQVRRTDIKRMLASLAVQHPADPVAFLDELVGNPQAAERRPTWAQAGNDRCELMMSTSSTSKAAGGWSGELPASFSPPLVLDSRARKVREFPDATGSRVERRLNRLALEAEQEQAATAAFERRAATPATPEPPPAAAPAAPAVFSSGVEIEVASVALRTNGEVTRPPSGGLSQSESDEVDGAIASEIIDELLDEVQVYICK